MCNLIDYFSVKTYVTITQVQKSKISRNPEPPDMALLILTLSPETDFCDNHSLFFFIILAPMLAPKNYNLALPILEFYVDGITQYVCLDHFIELCATEDC